MTEHILIALATIAGISAHIIKKVVQKRTTDSTFSLKRYLTEFPYKTMMTVFYAGAGVAGLYYAGDQSAYTALTVGFAANSLSGASDG